jgi:tetratricopeptide (TPR) repeat protein
LIKASGILYLQFKTLRKTMTHDVFISYSSKDKPVADGICFHIEAAGVRCWIAPRDIAPGEDWPSAIARAIPTCRIMVLVFSANSNASDQISRELSLAADGKLLILPFKIDDIKPEPGKQYYLARTHWLDAINPPTQEQIKQLVNRVRGILAMPETPQIPPAQSPRPAVVPGQAQATSGYLPFERHRWEEFSTGTEAVEYYESRMAWMRRASDKPNKLFALLEMGKALNQLQESVKAIACFEQALTLARELGDRQGEVEALRHIADGYLCLGQNQKAARLGGELLDLVKGVGDRYDEGEALFLLSWVEHSLGNQEKAVDLLRQAKAVFSQIPGESGEKVRLRLEEWGVEG